MRCFTWFTQYSSNRIISILFFIFLRFFIGEKNLSLALRHFPMACTLADSHCVVKNLNCQMPLYTVIASTFLSAFISNSCNMSLFAYICKEFVWIRESNLVNDMGKANSNMLFDFISSVMLHVCLYKNLMKIYNWTTRMALRLFVSIFEFCILCKDEWIRQKFIYRFICSTAAQ